MSGLPLNLGNCIAFGSLQVGFPGHSLPSADSRRAVVSYWRKNVHFALVSRLGERCKHAQEKSVMTDCPDMTIDVYGGRSYKSNKQTIIKLEKRLTH